MITMELDNIKRTANLCIIRKLLLLLVILFLVPYCYAKEDLLMKVNQSEYYFLVGEESVIPVEFENNLDEDLTGILTSAVTQEVNQGNVHYSSSSTNSQSFNINKGYSVRTFSFGTSDSPVDLIVDLSYSYNSGDDKIISLGDIIIHFVSDPSQKQDNNQQKQSVAGSKPDSAGANKPEDSMMQQMQQKLDEMFNQPSQQSMQSSQQQRLQNNQLNQDTSALKEQMQRQMQQQQQINEKFKENLEQNKDLQKEHQKLMQEGYEQKGGSFNAKNSTTGEFELNYEKDGKTVKLQGKLENNEITQLEKKSTLDDESLMDKIKQDDKFIRYDDMLNKSGYSQQMPVFNKKGNITNVEVPYIRSDNSTAAIEVTLEDGQIKKIELKKDKRNNWLYYLLILALVLVITYILYRRYNQKNNMRKERKEIQEIEEKPIDYRKEALGILAQSKRLFSEGKEKDAYGKAAEAIRFYYSYKLGIKKEITNAELISYLKHKKISYERTQKCLNLCGMVEFARYKANKKDFDKIIGIAKEIIR